MKKHIITITVLMLASFATAQVGLGKSDITNESILLDFDDDETNFRGIILPAISTEDMPVLNFNNNGTFIFDLKDSKIKMFENENWIELTEEGDASSIEVNPADEIGEGVIIGSGNTDALGVLVLESEDKAMVLPKIANPHETVKSPYPGMICYDTVSNLYTLSEKVNYQKGKIFSLLYIGELYMVNAQYQNAIEQFDKIDAFPSAEDTYNYKIKALQNKANAYIRLGFYDDASRVLDESDELTKSVKGNIIYFLKGISTNIRAELSSAMKMPADSTLYYLRKAAIEFKKIENHIPREAKLTDIYVSMGENFILLNQTDSALYYTKKILSFSYSDKQSQMKVFKLMGGAYMEKNNTDSAIYYYRKSLAIADKMGHAEGQKELNKSLASIYEKLSDEENYTLHNKEFKKVSDSITAIEKISVNKASNSIKKELTQKAEKTKQNLYLIIGGILLALCTIAFFAYKFFKNYNHEKIEKELKQEKIDEKENELRKVKLQVNESFDEIVHLAKTNDPTFLTRFKEIYPEFYEKMNEVFPEITQDQLKFCALVKLNFSTKDIANYTFIDIRSVQTKRSRLRKKLGIPPEEDMYLWMDKLN